MRMAVLSDMHGNMDAFQKVLEDMGRFQDPGGSYARALCSV